MIPVMLFGVMFAKKRYSLTEYLCVGLITAGIVTFNLSKAADKNKEVCAPGSYIVLSAGVVSGGTEEPRGPAHRLQTGFFGC